MDATDTTNYADVLDALAGTWVQPGSCETFSRIRARFDRELDESEIRQVSACIGYAVKEFLRCPDRELPHPIIENTGHKTTLFFDFEFNRWQTFRSNLARAAMEAFDAAAEYVVTGSPAYKTDRVGPVGSRLVEGIGEVRVVFHVMPNDEF